MTVLALCMTASRRRGSVSGKIAWIVRERGRRRGLGWEVVVEGFRGVVWGEDVVPEGAVETLACAGCRDVPVTTGMNASG